MTSAPAVAAEPTPAASATPSDPAGGPGRTSASPRPGARRRARPRLGLLLSAGFLVVVLLAALFPSLLAPGDPFAGASGATLEPPGPGHWLGTDHLGRDLYTRVVHGTRLTVATAAAAALVLHGLEEFGVTAPGHWVHDAAAWAAAAGVGAPDIAADRAAMTSSRVPRSWEA